MAHLCRPPAGSNCTGCNVDIEDRALRCTKCSGYVHLGCSGFPVYHLVRFESTKTTYVCYKCVIEDLGAEKYNKSAGAIEAEIQKFETARGLANSGSKSRVCVEKREKREEIRGIKDQTTVIKDQGDVEAEVLEPNAPSLQELEHDDSIIRELRGEKTSSGAEVARKRNRVCKHFLQKKCKHGKRGDECDFEHPKICFRFSKFGEKHPGGCKKGKKCQFYHPPLCWKSVNGEKCERKNCKFFHIRVPRLAGLREKDSNVKDQNADIQPSWARNADPKVTRNQPMERPWSAVDNLSGRNVQRDQIHIDDFLEIKKELHELRMQLERLMSLTEDTRGRKAPGRCSCH